MVDRLPPVSVSQWLNQTNGDHLIPTKYKNGAESHLKVYEQIFKSGSDLNSTDHLHLRTICHKYFRIEALGDLMKDDGDGYTGFVSAENMRKASRIFHTKKPLWQKDLDELTERASEEERSVVTRSSGNRRPDRIRVPFPSQPLRPSLDSRDRFYWSRYYQILTTTLTSKKAPTTHDIERTSKIVKFGLDPADIQIPSAVNQPITPSTPRRGSRLTPGGAASSTQSTPDIASYYPARGGRSNMPANDEFYVNAALLLFLQAITVAIGGAFSSLDWLGTRLPFELTEHTTKISPDAEDIEEVRRLMEARVDGYLSRRPSPFDGELNTAALAILEVKPFTLQSALSAIRRQQGAEMACWISQDSRTLIGLLQSSTSGRERRLLISQHRHEIYITVAEYGEGFKQHIRPSRTIVQGSMQEDRAESGDPSPRSTTAERGSSPAADNSSTDSDSTIGRRNPALLAGSPSYISRVESKGIEVAADPRAAAGRVQPTRSAPGMEDWQANDGRWTPDCGDFLIMHEFGPFSTKNPDHMDLFKRRFIAFSLQLRGPLPGFVPETTEAEFLRQPATPLPSTLSEPSQPRRNLRKARSWQSGKEPGKWGKDWAKPYTKWQG